MAKLVNQPEGIKTGAQKKFSLLVKRKLYEEEYENHPHLFVSEGFEIKFVAIAGSYANQ
jgi:hypothetical protein